MATEKKATNEISMGLHLFLAWIGNRLSVFLESILRHSLFVCYFWIIFCDPTQTQRVFEELEIGAEKSETTSKVFCFPSHTSRESKNQQSNATKINRTITNLINFSINCVNIRYLSQLWKCYRAAREWGGRPGNTTRQTTEISAYSQRGKKNIEWINKCRFRTNSSKPIDKKSSANFLERIEYHERKTRSVEWVIWWRYLWGGKNAFSHILFQWVNVFIDWQRTKFTNIHCVHKNFVRLLQLTTNLEPFFFYSMHFSLSFHIDVWISVKILVIN